MHKWAFRLLVLVSAYTFVGCAGYDSYRSLWENLVSPPPRTYYSASWERHRRHEHRLVARKRPATRKSTTTTASKGVLQHRLVARKRPATRKSTATTASEGVLQYTGRAALATAVASNPPARLSLIGDGSDRVRTQRLLAAVDNKLVRARDQGLKGAQKDTYERAGQLANGARQALADDDWAAASSLAAKASSLADIAGP